MQVFAGFFSMGFTPKPNVFFGYYPGVWTLVYMLCLLAADDRECLLAYEQQVQKLKAKVIITLTTYLHSFSLVYGFKLSWASLQIQYAPEVFRRDRGLLSPLLHFEPTGYTH